MTIKKNLLGLLFATFGFVGLLRAVSQVPYTEVVSFSLRLNGDGAAGMTIYEESGYVITSTFASGADVESYTNNAIMRPGKVYTMAVSGSGSGYSLWASFITPTGYRLYVDGVQTTMLPFGSRTTISENHTLELRPSTDVDTPKPFGEFSGIAIGKSISWEVGLGELYGGRSAGRIAFKEYDLTTSPASRARLFLGKVNGLGEVWTITDTSTDVLRQVIAPLGVVDLLDDGSGGYWIRFFANNQAEGSPGNPFILYGSPWKTIHVESPGTNQLRITEAEGSATRVSLLSLSSTSGSVASGNYIWTLQEGDGSTWLRTTTHTSATASAIGTGGTVTTSGNYTFHTFTSNGTFTLSEPTAVTYLVVGGGGGGGGGSTINGGGGGGGGGLVSGSSAFANGSFSVTIGSGGAAGTSGAGGDGGSSSVNGVTAYGGGGGGGYQQGGHSGGCGGGAGRDSGYGGGGGSQGGGGGDSGGTSWGSAGGGGGAGTNGQTGGTDSAAWSAYHGNGGNAGISTIYGDVRAYAGGGGGAWQTGGSGTPQPGTGGGAGSNYGGTGGDGTDGYGGGGGGGQYSNGGHGGSGVIVLRYTNVREETVVVRTGGTTGTVVAKTKYRYEDVGGWGEELTQVVNDPDSAALTTVYTYYTNSSDLGNYRRVRSVTDPTGNWSAQEYYNDWNRRGQLNYDYSPHLDLPATVPSTFSTTTGRVVHFDYEADWSGRFSRPNLREEKVNGVTTAKTTWTAYGDTSAWGWPVEYWTENSFSGASSSQSSYHSRFRADAWPTIAFHTYAANGADETRIAWSNVNGGYDASSGAFSAGTSNSHIRYATLHGTINSGGATSVSSWDGNSFDATYLIPNKSTMDVSIWSGAGLMMKTETWVYTSGGFVLLNWEKFSYNDQGRLTERRGSNDATTSYTYPNGLLTSTVDPAGTETQFTYDALWRTATSAKIGVSGGSYPNQDTITTHYTYDGANNVTQIVVGDSSPTLTTSAAFDHAGRPTSRTAPGGYTTSFSYSSGGKVVDTTFPSGSTKTTEKYLDGQVKQVTGNGVVNEFFTPDVDSSGNRTLAYRQASLSTTAVTTTTYDWLGRKIAVVQPTWSGGTATQAWYYDSYGHLWKMTQTGVAPTLYSYNSMGELLRQVLDVNTNDSVDFVGPDRITETATYINGYDSGTTWWLEKQNYVFVDGSSTPKLTGATYQRLNLPANTLSETWTTDIYGNRSHQVTTVNSSSKLVTTTTDVADSTTAPETKTYNGLLISSRDRTNITMTFGYDTLGRPATSFDPRTGTTTTAYMSGTSQVYTVTDPASMQTTYGYDLAGRLQSTASPNPHNGIGGDTRPSLLAYTSYTPRGEILRQWGDTTYPVEYSYDNWGRRTTMSTYRGGSGWNYADWPGTGSNSSNTPGAADVTQWNFQEATGLMSSKVTGYGTSDAKTVSYSYTAARQINVRTWARGVTTSYSYSSTTGELTGVDYSDSTPDLTYTYNRLGNQATVADATGTRTLNYNLSGTLELQSEDLPSFFGTRRVTYPHATSGVIGRPTGLQLGTSSSPTNDESVTYGYDTYGRFNSLAGGGTTLAYSYTSASNLLSSIEDTVSGWKQTRTYLSNRDLLDVIETKVGTTSEAKFDYAHDSLGRRTSVNKTGALYTRYGNGTQGLDTYWGYDDRSQVISEVTDLGGSSTPLDGREDSYAWDNIGNRSGTAGTTHNGNAADYTTNALNQYTQRSSAQGVLEIAGATSTSTATVFTNGVAPSRPGSGGYFFQSFLISNSTARVTNSVLGVTTQVKSLNNVYGFNWQNQTVSTPTVTGPTGQSVSVLEFGGSASCIGIDYDNRYTFTGHYYTFENGHTYSFGFWARTTSGSRTITPMMTDDVNSGITSATHTIDTNWKWVTVTKTYSSLGSGSDPRLFYNWDSGGGAFQVSGAQVADITDPQYATELPSFLAATPESFTYDDDGNLTRDGRWVYVYDAENRLVAQFTRGAPSDDPDYGTSANSAVWTSGVAQQKLLFKHDYLGRRIDKIVSNWNSTSSTWVPASEERFVYSGWNVIAKLDALSSNTLTASYYWGLDWSGTLQGAGGVGGLLMTREGGVSYLPIFDGTGNVMGMIRASDGSLAAAYEYDAFGQTLRESGTYAASNPFRFSTKYTDIESGLIYYGLRYYSPSLGRFINEDPIEERGGLNLYAFCCNNAIAKWDYMGMDPVYEGGWLPTMVVTPTSSSIAGGSDGFAGFGGFGGLGGGGAGGGDASQHDAHEFADGAVSTVQGMNGLETYILKDGNWVKVAANTDVPLGPVQKSNGPTAAPPHTETPAATANSNPTAPDSGARLTIGEFLSAAASGAGEGLYKVTVGAVVDSYRDGVNQMADSIIAAQKGDFTLATLNGLAAAGNVANLALTAVGAGELLGEGGKLIGAGLRGAEADMVNLASPERTIHILEGDATGGGHMFPGLPDKTPFPEGWSGPKIMNAVSDIATDPAAVRTVQSNGRILVTGTREGVTIHVVLEPASKGGGIVTAFPKK